MFTGPTCGGRCGVSRRSIRSCSRSASLMMTCVYSRRSGRSSSRSSSWAEPRSPPSGFLISCARLRISSRLATACWSRLRSSRSIRSCWSIERNSSTSRARPCSAGVTRQFRCSGGSPGRSRSIAWSRTPVLRDRVAELRVELPHLHEEIREALAGELPCGGLEQVLGRRVRVEDAQLRIEHDDRRGEQIETGERRSVHPPPSRGAPPDGGGDLPQRRELPLEGGDVLLVPLDRILVGLAGGRGRAGSSSRPRCGPLPARQASPPRRRGPSPRC